MMLANSAPLAAEEQALSNSISQLAANVFQDTQALRALDVAVQSAVVQGLTAKVQDQLRHYRSLLSDLQHAAEEQETPDQTQRVANVLAKHQTDYDSIHKGFQEARISYTRRKEQSYVQQQRQELIGSVDFSQRQQQFASEQEAEQRTQDVTASLRRTRQLMAQNLEQTHGNISVIASGNKRLQEAGDELSGQKHLFKESHGLLSTLKTQSLWDRFTVWGGFAFFILVVLYISFKRTPAFMKQPLYALLHMKHGGKPFDHHDYASVNIPPGTFTPLDKPWAADEGSGSEAYPSEWSAWDAHYVEGSEHGQDVLVDGQWSAQDLLNEGLQQGSAEDLQGPPGTLRDKLQTQQEQQHGPPGKQQSWQQQQQHVEEPGTPMQQQEQPFRDQCAAGDLACHTASAQQQQQQPHDDVDEVAFHSDDQHQGLRDHEELEYLQQQQQQDQQQQQQQQQQDHPQQQQQERVLQEQQEVDRSLQQQQEQQRLAARESAAARVAAEAAELKAALRAQQQAPQVDQSHTATEGAAVEDQAAHAAPPAQPTATQPGPTTDGPSAEATEAVSVEPAAAPATAQEQPPGFETPAAADSHKPVSTEQPAAAPSREQLLEVPLGPAAQQADTLVQESLPEDAAPGPAPHADQQAAAEPPAPQPGHGEPHAAAHQHPAVAQHSAADTGHVSPQQPDVVTQLDKPDSAGVQLRHLSADGPVHRDPEVHAGHPAATGAAEQPGSSEQPPPTAAVDQPSVSEAPVDGQLQAGGAAEQDRPQVHVVEQAAEQATVQAPAAAPTDAVLGAPGTPAAAAPTLEHADELQRQLQADHQQQQLLQPPDAPAAAEAVPPEQEQQSHHLGAGAQADSLDAAPTPAPAVVDGDPAHKLEQPDIEAVQLGDSNLQQQQSQEPTAAPTPVPPPASEQHSDQQVEAVLPELASTSTHAAPVAVQATGSTAPEVAAPVDVTEVVSSAQQERQQHAVEPQQPFSTFDNEAELVHQPSKPSQREAPVDDWTGLAGDSVSSEPTNHHRQLEAQQAEPPAAPVSDTEQPVVASAHQGDVQQGTTPAPQEEERPEYEQVQRQHQQLEDELVHLGQANKQQPELLDQAVPVSTEQQPQQQQQQKASGLLQDSPAQPPAVTDQVPEHHHQQQQQAVKQQHTDAAALPKPATIVAALPVQTAAPVAGAAESAQRTAATISTAAEDVVGAAVEAVSVAEQVQKAVSNTGKSFGAKVLSRWGGHSGLAAIGGTKAVKQQSAGAAAAVRRGGGSSFIPAAAAAEISPPARPQEGPATYAGSGLDYYADDMSSEQQGVEADTGAAPATGSKETTQHPHTINPDSLSAAELDQLSKQIEEEQRKAFTIMDMEDVGLYRYDEQGNAVLRDGLSSAARQGGGSSGSGAASEHVEL